MPRLLLVLSAQRRALLLPLLEGEDAEIEWAMGFQDAVRKLSASPSYDLLLVDAELPDGSWRNLLLFVQNSGMVSEMIIVTRVEDHRLWAEVIQCGAYDLIVEPVEREELTRIIHNALQGHYMQRFTKAAKAASRIATA